MIIFDFFAGTGSSTQAFKDAGHTVITFELDDKFDATENVDIMDLTASYLLETYGQPDFIWASPPCTAFSIAGVRHHWISGGENPIPKSELAVTNQKLVLQTKKLCMELKPTHGFLIENPRGMLRKLKLLDDLPRKTISYCQYGDFRMKPTDLWGQVDNWIPKPICGPGKPCHEASPRGSTGGTQGMANNHLRSMVPIGLSQELLKAIESST